MLSINFFVLKFIRYKFENFTFGLYLAFCQGNSLFSVNSYEYINANVSSNLNIEGNMLETCELCNTEYIFKLPYLYCLKSQTIY